MKNLKYFIDIDNNSVRHLRGVMLENNGYFERTTSILSNFSFELITNKNNSSTKKQS